MVTSVVVRTSLLALVIVLAAAVFTLTQVVAHGGATDALYVVPIMASLFLPGRRPVFLTASVATGLTILGAGLIPAGSEMWVILQNHLYSVFAVWSVAGVGILRKRSEEQLEHARDDLAVALSEDRGFLDSLLEHSPDVMIVVNGQGTVLFANSAITDVFGYQREEFIGEGVELLLPESLRAMHTVHRESYVEEPRFREMGALLDLLARRKDGSEFPVEISLAPLPPDSEHGFRVMAIVRDVTLRTRAMRMLSQAHRVSGMGAWELDLATRRLTWADETPRLFGLLPGQVPTTHEDFLHLIPPQDHPRVVDAFDQAIRRKTPYELEHRMLLPNGEERIVYEQAEVVYDAAGNALKMVGAVQDITDRSRLTAMLSMAQRITHLGSWQRDLVTNALQWSDEVYRIFGLAPGQIPSSFPAFMERVHPEDRSLVQESLDRAVRGEGPHDVDHRIVLPDGTERIVHEQAEVSYDPSGKPVRLLGTVQDVTDRRRIEERLRLLISLRQLVAAAPDFEAALKAALEKICRETGWDYGEAWVPDQSGGHLNLILSWSEGGPEFEEFRRVSAETRYRTREGVPGRVWASLAPEWTPDLTQQPSGYFPRYDLAVSSGLRSVLGAPVIDGDDVSAVLLFFRADARALEETVIESVTELTAGLGLVLQRTKAQDSLLMQTEELHTLYKISSVNTREADPDAKLKAILEEVVRISDASIAVLRVVDSTADNFVTKVIAGPSAEELETRPSVPANGSRAGQAFTEGRPIVENDYAPSPNAVRAWVDGGIQSFAVVPLEGSNQRLGIIAIGAKNAANFTPHRIRLLRTVSSDVSHILEKMLDEEELQKKNEELEESLQDKEVLLREVHHRVKNNLAVISSLLNLQATQTNDDSARRALQDSRNRVQSMALVHEQLYQTSDVAQIDFADYVRSLVSELSMSYDTHTSGISVGVDAERVRLTLDEAIPTGLIIQELVSNAYKHAFPDGRAGHIHVDVRSKPEETCIITVSDDGVGNWARETAGRPASLGLSLIDSLSGQLDGHLTHDTSSGTRTTLEFALKSVADAPLKGI